MDDQENDKRQENVENPVLNRILADVEVAKSIDSSEGWHTDAIKG